jgi:hypothetical protein
MSKKSEEKIKKQARRHAKARFKERANVKLNNTKRAEILSGIKNGRYELSDREIKSDRGVRLIYKVGKYDVVVDVMRNEIITILYR